MLKSMSPGRDELYRLYYEDCLSYEEIARRFGVTRTSVMRWFRAAGISARSRSVAAALGNAKYPDRPKQREAARKTLKIARKSITPGSYRKMVVTRQKNGVNYRSGPANHMWRGGGARTISTRAWAKRARECYERDNWICQGCGWLCLPSKHAAEIEPRLRVQAHHIVARRHGGGDELGNLVTLCLSCHRKREATEGVI